MHFVRPDGRSAALAVALACSLGACASIGGEQPPAIGESFGAEGTYSRTYQATPASACEASRRALLGQGYVIAKADAAGVEAAKNFQPKDDVHTQLNVRVTCVPQSGNETIVFVNALQDRYELATTANTASVGLTMIGSLSVPIGTGGGNLVKVASNTVQNPVYYRGFFERVQYYLPGTTTRAEAPPPPEPEAPPDPVPPAPAPAAPAPAPEAAPAPAAPTPPPIVLPPDDGA